MGEFPFFLMPAIDRTDRVSGETPTATKPTPPS